MRPVGELVLVLGLLVSARCEVRARDPEVEEETGGGGRRLTETPLLGAAGSQTGTGNRCAFLQRRVLTEPCGQRRHVRDQSPCSSGSPGCHKNPFQLPCLKKKEVTALVWRCCPGHRGPNCEDEDKPVGLPQRADPDREQNDHQESYTAPYDPNDPRAVAHPNPGPQTTRHHPAYHHHHQGQNQPPYRTNSQVVEGMILPYPDLPSALPVPEMMALVMSQLQPFLERFNRSLERLDQQVGVLSRDVAELKTGHPGAELQEDELETQLDVVFQQIGDVRRQVEQQRGYLENRLQRNISSFRMDVDQRLEQHRRTLQVSLQAMNTTLAEINLDPGQIPDEISGQIPNKTPDKTPGKIPDKTPGKIPDKTPGKIPDKTPGQIPYKTPGQIPDKTPGQIPDKTPGQIPDKAPVDPSQSMLSSHYPPGHTALWDAISQLDDLVDNNTMKVEKLAEEAEVSAAEAERTTQQLEHLEKLINQTARGSRILFMETGLEVEQSKVSVLRQVGELAANMTLHDKRLQENDLDLDYLYTAIYNLNLSTDCNCAGLTAAMARLERGVANATQLANENRLALEENSELVGARWGGASDWEPAVEALQKGLRQVKESVALEQNRTRTPDPSLSGSVSALQEAAVRIDGQLKTLSASFRSLLQDAIRHSDVLQLLLGEEVLEFLEWPVQDQEAHSIPALKEHLRELKEELRRRQERGGGETREEEEEEPPADQPAPPLPRWPPGGSRRNSDAASGQQRPLLPGTELQAGDGGDLWRLERKVEQLERRLVRVEAGAPPAGEDTSLQVEVMLMRRSLEEHLRTFKDVFANADALTAAGRTLELDRLWRLMKRREEKEAGRGRGRGSQRSQREAAGEPVSFSQSEVSLLFVGVSPRSALDGSVTFEPNRNQNLADPQPGVFTAPADGIYLFIMTFDLQPGPAHVVLRRERGVSVVTMQRQVEEAGPVSGLGLLQLSDGEQVRLQVSAKWAESDSNLLAVLRLQI